MLTRTPRLTLEQKAEMAGEAFDGHTGRCPGCRTLCQCGPCQQSKANLCPMGRRLLEVAADRVALIFGVE